MKIKTREQGGIVRQLEAEELEGFEGLLASHPTIGPWKRVRPFTVTHIPSGLVFADGASTEEAIEQAKKLAGLITEAGVDIRGLTKDSILELPEKLKVEIKRIRGL